MPSAVSTTTQALRLVFPMTLRPSLFKDTWPLPRVCPMLHLRLVYHQTSQEAYVLFPKKKN